MRRSSRPASARACMPAVRRRVRFRASGAASRSSPSGDGSVAGGPRRQRAGDARQRARAQGDAVATARRCAPGHAAHRRGGLSGERDPRLQRPWRSRRGDTAVRNHWADLRRGTLGAVDGGAGQAATRMRRTSPCLVGVSPLAAASRDPPRGDPARPSRIARPG